MKYLFIWTGSLSFKIILDFNAITIVIAITIIIIWLRGIYNLSVRSCYVIPF